MSQYPAVIELADLDGADGFKLSGGAADDRAGSSVSYGDIDNDGFTDIVVGAPGNSVNTGITYVVFGQATAFAADLALSSLDGTNGFKMRGDASADTSGNAVSAGDIDGDGIDDVIIGATGASPGAAFSGAAYVVFGKTTAFAANINLANLNGNNGFQIIGADGGDNAGKSVSAAGDVNGDSIGDLIVGAFNADPHGSGSGAAFVLFGKDTGFGASVDLSDIDGNNGYKLSGVSGLDGASNAVAASDVNGDGFSDLVVGASEADANGAGSGATYVVFGQSNFSANQDLSSLDGDNGFRLVGEAAGDRSGYSVAGGGDINGDGFADIIVGAKYSSSGGSISGSSYVVFGSASGFTADVNLDALNGANGFRIVGAASSDASGWSVGSAGDFNGDGFDDVIVGSPASDPNGNESGSAFILFGKASGFTADVGLSGIDGTNGIRINGLAEYDAIGVSVSGAGDVNGDGFADVVVGAPQADPNGDGSGAAFVVFGGKPGEDVARTGTGIANIIRGGDFDDTLSGAGGDDTLVAYSGDDAVYGGSGEDDINAGAGDDAVSGGSGDDSVRGSSGADGIHGGAGNDTVFGDSGGDNLDGGSGNDGVNGGQGSDTLFGSDGNDVLNGNAGGDRLIGGDGKDTLTGGANQDLFVYRLAAESTSTHYDTVRNADFALDLWDVSGNVTGIDAGITHGRLSPNAQFNAKLAAAVDAAHLGPHHAVLFTPDGGSLSGQTFLVVDLNGVAGYQKDADLVVRLDTPVNIGNLDAGNFI